MVRKAKHPSKLPDWLWPIIDRAVYVAVSAAIAAFMAWMQRGTEVKQLKSDVQNLEWGVDYFRSNN